MWFQQKGRDGILEVSCISGESIAIITFGAMIRGAAWRASQLAVPKL